MTILEYSVIPEPSTLVLLLCGGVWLLISAWRRRRHNNPNLGTCR